MVPGHEAKPPRGIGLALLLREGMPGWLKAVTHVLSAALAQTKHGTSPRVRHVHATSPAAGASALAPEAHEHPAFGTISRGRSGTTSRYSWRAWSFRLAASQAYHQERGTAHVDDRGNSAEDHERTSVAQRLPVRATVDAAAGPGKHRKHQEAVRVARSGRGLGLADRARRRDRQRPRAIGRERLLLARASSDS